MKILDRYVLLLFLKSFFIALGSFILIFVVLDFFEKVGGYIDRDTPASVVFRLYLYQIPYFMMVVMPIAMLLASLFTLGRLSRDNELTPMLGAGRPVIRILVPIFIVGLLVSWASYHFNDQVVTRSNQRLESLQEAQEAAGKQSPRERGDVLRQVTRRGPGGTFYWGETYSVKGQTFDNIAVMRFDGPRLREYTLSKEALWSGEGWMLRDGSRRSIAGDGEDELPAVRTENYAVLHDTGPSLLPEDFSRQEKKPESMEYAELRDHIERSSRIGEDAERMLVDLHIKTSYPAANFIIVLLGAALSATRRRITLAAGFGWTVGLAFIYILMLRMGLSLGHNEMLPPLLAAWVANIAFLALGLGLLIRANR